MTILLAASLPAAFFFFCGIKDSAFRSFPDDALFYDIIARNIVAGEGSSCDGIAFSNGYHPLWMGLNIALAWIGENTLAWKIVLQFFILCGSLLLLHSYLSIFAGRATALLACLFVSFEQTYYMVLFCGMESQLAFFALLAVLKILQGQRWDSLSPQRLAGLSAALAFLFFSRLDSGLMFPALATVFFLSGPWPKGALAKKAQRLICIFAIPSLLIILYMWLNYRFFSCATPISGRVKSISLSYFPTADLGAYFYHAWVRAYSLFLFDFIDRPLRLLAPSGWLATLKSVYLVCLAIFLAWSTRKAFLDNPRELSIRAFAVYVAAHSFYYLFLQWDTIALNWAKGPEILFAILMASRVIEKTGVFDAETARGRALAKGATALLLAGALVCGGIRCQRLDRIQDFGVSPVDFDEAMRYIRSDIPPEAVIASHSIGFLGYYSGRKVFSLDGLLNSWDYNKHYRNKYRTLDYMREHQVRHLLFACDDLENPVKFLCQNGLIHNLEESMVKATKVFSDGVDGSRVSHGYVFYELDFDKMAK